MTVHKRKERVIAAHADPGARMELGSTLAHDNIAGNNALAAIALHAQIFWIRIAPVA